MSDYTHTQGWKSIQRALKKSGPEHIEVEQYNVSARVCVRARVRVCARVSMCAFTLFSKNQRVNTFPACRPQGEML